MEKSLNGGMTETPKDKLVNDFKQVINHAQEFFRDTAAQSGDKFAELRSKFQENLDVAKDRLAEAEAAMLEKTKEAARATDVYVRENPWKAVGIAAGVGFAVALLLRRR